MKMAPTRTRSKKAEILEDINLDDIEEVEEVEDEEQAAPARKYFSHANCDHARKGEAGKAARAACRRAIRTWLAAEADEVVADVAV